MGAHATNPRPPLAPQERFERAAPSIAAPSLVGADEKAVCGLRTARLAKDVEGGKLDAVPVEASGHGLD